MVYKEIKKIKKKKEENEIFQQKTPTLSFVILSSLKTPQKFFW